MPLRIDEKHPGVLLKPTSTAFLQGNPHGEDSVNSGLARHHDESALRFEPNLAFSRLPDASAWHNSGRGKTSSSDWSDL
jgi:hypothetical protein